MESEDATGPGPASRTKVPRSAWVLLIVAASLGLVQTAWNTVTFLISPPLVYVDASAPAVAAPYDDDRYDDDQYEDDRYDDDRYDDDQYDDDQYDDDQLHDDDAHSADHDLYDDEHDAVAFEARDGLAAEDAEREREEGGRDETSALDEHELAPIADEPSTPPDVSAQIAQLRGRIRERAEAEREQEEAYAAATQHAADDHAADEPSTDPLGDDVALAMADEPWDSILRAWLHVLVWLLMALGAGFVALRTADRRYAFAALCLAVLAGVEGAHVLLWQLVSPDAAWPLANIAHRTTGHLTTLAIALIALTSKRRAGLLASLVLGAALAGSIALTSHSWGALSTIVSGVAVALPFCVVAFVSAQQLRDPAAGARHGEGPYREAILSADDSFAPHSLRAAAVALGGWFAVQFLAAPIRELDLIEASDLRSYLVAADAAVAIMATLHLRACRDERERNQWALTAAMLWLVTLAGAFLDTSLVRFDFRVPVGALVASLTTLGLSGVAMAALVAALRTTTLARLCADQEPPPAPHPRIVFALAVDVIALRLLSRSPFADATWFVLAILAVIGLASFVRVTNRFRASLRKLEPQ